MTRGTAPRGARPPGLIATALCAALAVFGRAAFAQSPAAETTAPEAPPAVGAQQPFPLLFGLFDLSAAYTFPAKVIGSAGRMSSTFLTGRLAPVIRLNPRLYLSFPLDGSVSFYQFEGDPGLLPAGGSPWDQVRSFAVGAQARYRVDEHWILLGEINLASTGARGAPFGKTLSTGATFGRSIALDRT